MDRRALQDAPALPVSHEQTVLDQDRQQTTKLAAILVGDAESGAHRLRVEARSELERKLQPLQRSQQVGHGQSPQPLDDRGVGRQAELLDKQVMTSIDRRLEARRLGQVGDDGSRSRVVGRGLLKLPAGEVEPVLHWRLGQPQQHLFAAATEGDALDPSHG